MARMLIKNHVGDYNNKQKEIRGSVLNTKQLVAAIELKNIQTAKQEKRKK